MEGKITDLFIGIRIRQVPVTDILDRRLARSKPLQNIRCRYERSATVTRRQPPLQGSHGYSTISTFTRALVTDTRPRSQISVTSPWCNLLYAWIKMYKNKYIDMLIDRYIERKKEG